MELCLINAGLVLLEDKRFGFNGHVIRIDDELVNYNWLRYSYRSETILSVRNLWRSETHPDGRASAAQILIKARKRNADAIIIKETKNIRISVLVPIKSL